VTLREGECCYQSSGGIVGTAFAYLFIVEEDCNIRLPKLMLRFLVESSVVIFYLYSCTSSKHVIGHIVSVNTFYERNIILIPTIPKIIFVYTVSGLQSIKYYECN